MHALADTRANGLHAWAAWGSIRAPKGLRSLRRQHSGFPWGAAWRWIRGRGRPGYAVAQRLPWAEPSRGPTSTQVPATATRHTRASCARRHSLEPGCHLPTRTAPAQPAAPAPFPLHTSSAQATRRSSGWGSGSFCGGCYAPGNGA